MLTNKELHKQVVFEHTKKKNIFRTCKNTCWSRIIWISFYHESCHIVMTFTTLPHLKITWLYTMVASYNNKIAMQNWLPTLCSQGHYSLSGRASYHKISCEISNPQYSGLDFSNRFAICQATRQQFWRYSWKSSERYYHYNIQSRGFEIFKRFGGKTS